MTFTINSNMSNEAENLLVCYLITCYSSIPLKFQHGFNFAFDPKLSKYIRFESILPKYSIHLSACITHFTNDLHQSNNLLSPSKLLTDTHKLQFAKELSIQNPHTNSLGHWLMKQLHKHKSHCLIMDEVHTLTFF